MKEEIYLFDKDGNIVQTEEEADSFSVRILNDEGELIQETYGNVKKQNEPCEITQEEYDMLISKGYELNDSEFKVIK